MRTMGDAELEMLDELSRDFAARELAGRVEENDEFPFGPLFEDVLGKATEVGFASIMLPADLGGSGYGIRALCLVLENISEEDASLAGVLLTNALAQQLVMNACGEDVPPGIISCGGDFRESLLAFPAYNNPAQIEPVARAVMKDGAYMLSGKVEYVVLGGVARRAVLPARIEGGEGVSFFAVDLSGEGVSVSEPVLSLGLRACPAVDLKLDAAECHLMGEEGGGASYYTDASDSLSVAGAAMAVGVMKGSLEEAFSYVKQRRQGGREIINWSEVRRMLADMVIDVETCGMTTEGACRSMEEDEPGWRLGARAAAIRIQETACRLTTDGIQLLGGYGYMKDYGQEKRFRDAKQLQALLGLAPARKLSLMTRIIDGEIPF